MLLYEENVYSTVYFYNAIIEFVHFVINHIQSKGPKHIAEIEKHLKFFKTEVDKFVNTFNGKSRKDRCCNMLCTATPAFYCINKVLYLNENISGFKNIIFEDLIINKTTDIILRGISDIEKICENLNDCNVVKVSKTVLLSILKQYSSFYTIKNDAIIIFKCQNLMSFHNHTYQKVVQYFLNILQNTYIIMYENVKSHSYFVSSHGIQSCLSTFCILNSCNIFNCQNSQVSLFKKYRSIITPKQHLNINYSQTNLSDPSSSLTWFIYQNLGPKIFNWTGHVSQLMKNGGLIYCSVDFNDNMQEMFVVYFHKRALKYIGDICNLSEHVSFQDAVEFDAEYNVGAAGRYYQASRVTVIKEDSKLGIDLDKYSKNISQRYFVQISQSNLNAGCPFYFNAPKTSLNPCCVKNYIPTDYDEFVSFLEDSFKLCLTEKIDNFCSTQEFDTPFLDRESRCDSSTSDAEANNKIKFEFTNTSKQKKEEEVKTLLEGDGISMLDTYDITKNNSNKISVKNGVICTNSSTKSEREEAEINIKSDALKQSMHCDKSKPIENPLNKNSLDDSKDTFEEDDFILSKKFIFNEHNIENFLILNYTFLFGEIDIVTKEGGIINCFCDNAVFTVYFLHKSLFNSVDHSELKNLARFDKVLIFSPNISDDIIPVATLVYLLEEEEAILIQKDNLTVKDFITKYFLPKIKLKQESLTLDYSLCPNLRFDVSFDASSSKFRDIRLKYHRYVKSLNDICTFDQNFIKKIMNLLLIMQNKYIKKDCISYTSLFQFFVWKKFSFFKFKRKCKNLFKLSFKSNIKQIPLNNDILVPSLSSLNLRNMNLKNKNFVLSKSKSETDLVSNGKLKENIQNDQIYNSCNSLNSVVSISSQISSDDRFYSCESSLNTSDIEEKNHTDTYCKHFKSTDIDFPICRNSSPEADISSIAKNFSFKSKEPILTKEISFHGSTCDFVKKSKHKFLSKNYSSEKNIFCTQSISKFKITRFSRKKPNLKFVDSLISSPKLVTQNASICMMTNSYLFLTPINYGKELFCFPLKSVSAVLKPILQIGSIVEITFIPFEPLNMSHMIYLKMQSSYK